jgi:pectate lyase
MKIPSFPRFCAGLLGTISLFPAPAPAASFPGAQGYGAVATGGTTVVHVTTLNESGPGSIREALGATGRRVVFDLAGTITIGSALVIPNDTTLDGTTAPSPGITVSGHSTSLSGRHNIIIRNLRFRETMSGPPKKCAVQGADGAYNIILDHCSIEQGRWDCLEFTSGSHDITVQWCIIGEGIVPQRFGCLFNALDHVSVHHNLFIDNQSRNPKLKANAQYINNVVYNWGGNGLVGGHSSAKWNSDVINNFFMAGPSSSAGSWVSQCTPSDIFHVAGNQYDLDKNGTCTPTNIPDADFAKQGVTLRPTVFHSPADAVTIDPPAQVMTAATGGKIGCQPLDEADQRLVGYLKSFGKLGQIGAP